MNDPHILSNYFENGEETDIEDETTEKELKAIMASYVPELINTSPKMIALFNIIDETLKRNEKLLVFSQILLTLNIIERCLQEKFKWAKNLQYYRIDGRASQLSRQNMVATFNNSVKLKLFLLSTKAGCLGISLVAANRVVLFDAIFNPSDDLQAVGRVFRYGQKRKTFIYKFIMEHCLEKAIFEHQIKKQQISKRLIDQHHPDPYMSFKAAMSTYLRYNENVEIDTNHFTASLQ
ncbi:Helicase ARIP4, partial [Pseudolycoriella hygida]